MQLQSIPLRMKDPRSAIFMTFLINGTLVGASSRLVVEAGMKWYRLSKEIGGCQPNCASTLLSDYEWNRWVTYLSITAVILVLSKVAFEVDRCRDSKVKNMDFERKTTQEYKVNDGENVIESNVRTMDSCRRYTTGLLLDVLLMGAVAGLFYKIEPLWAPLKKAKEECTKDCGDIITRYEYNTLAYNLTDILALCAVSALFFETIRWCFQRPTNLRGIPRRTDSSNGYMAIPGLGVTDTDAVVTVKAMTAQQKPAAAALPTAIPVSASAASLRHGGSMAQSLPSGPSYVQGRSLSGSLVAETRITMRPHGSVKKPNKNKDDLKSDLKDVWSSSQSVLQAD